MKLPLITVLFLLLFTFCLSAQEEVSTFTCGYDEIQQNLLDNDPTYKEQLRTYNEEYARTIRQQSDIERMVGIYTIPTVVHIIHADAALGTPANPTDEYVKNRLQEATDRLRHSSGLTFDNPYSGADTEIELCLVTTAPNSAYTTGIYRYYNPNLSIGSYQNNTALYSFINSTKWDVSKYLNIYLLHLTDAGGVYFTSNDVVAINPTFNSITTAHEVGHYLTLGHTFDGGCYNYNCLTHGDAVCDTPPQATSASNSNSCSTDDDDLNTRNPYRPVANGGLGDQPDMLENYMSYSSGKEFFTLGQKTRMRYNIESQRTSLINQSTIACASRTRPAYDIGVIDFDPCIASNSIQNVTIQNYGRESVNTFQLEILVNGSLAHTSNQSIVIPPNEKILIPLNNSISFNQGDNKIELRTRLPNGQTDGFINNDWSIKNAFNIVRTLPYEEQFSSTTWPQGYQMTIGGIPRWNLAATDGTNSACLGSHYAWAGSAGNGSFDGSYVTIMELPAISLENTPNATLDFKYKFTRFMGGTFLVKVSTCATSQEVWSGSEYDLTTNLWDSSDSDPNCNYNEIVTIDLSAFAGEPRISIEFIAEGFQFGSPFLLDSISISPTMPPCKEIPIGLTLVTKTSDSANLSWGSLSGRTYQLQWREKGLNSIKPWQVVETNTTNYNLIDLAAGTTYEWRLRAVCTGGFYSLWTDIQYFITDAPANCADLEIVDLVFSNISPTNSENSYQVDYSFAIRNNGNQPFNGNVRVATHASFDNEWSFFNPIDPPINHYPSSTNIDLVAQETKTYDGRSYYPIGGDYNYNFLLILIDTYRYL